MNEECYLLLSEIKDKSTSLTKSIAINGGEGADKLYSESLNIILLLTKLEEKMNSLESLKNTNSYAGSDAEEINKVKRRIPKWKKNPTQYNSKILEAFFQMQKDNITITEETFERHCKENYGHDFSFLTNFSQMHNIAPKNHAKVFDIHDNEVQLWKPVKEFIEGVWNE